MGMFDELHYEGQKYQTKDTPMQTLDTYKIEHDQCSGHFYLWHEEYESEWVDDEETFFGGYFKQYNKHWVCCHEFDGKIDFYRTEDNKTWIEYHSLFMNGQMLKIVKKPSGINGLPT
jgi:hypothetical protein